MRYTRRIAATVIALSGSGETGVSASPVAWPEIAVPLVAGLYAASQWQVHRQLGQLRTELAEERNRSVEALAQLRDRLPNLLAGAAQVAAVTPDATIPLHNLAPDPSLRQELRLKGGVLEPGLYQVDSPVRLRGKIIISGEVEFVGKGGLGRFISASFEIANGGMLKATAVTFSDLSASREAVVTVASGGNFEGRGGAFERCVPRNGAAALTVQPGGSATVQGTSFIGNQGGSMVWVHADAGAGASDLHIIDCIFADNVCDQGAVYVTGEGASATITGGEVRGTTTRDGNAGAIKVTGGGHASVNTNFTGNTRDTVTEGNGIITGTPVIKHAK
jgi:hypothetical protein